MIVAIAIARRAEEGHAQGRHRRLRRRRLRRRRIAFGAGMLVGAGLVVSMNLLGLAAMAVLPDPGTD